MISYHRLVDNEIDIRHAVENHSADEVITYKMVDNKPIRLGYYFPPEYDKHHTHTVFIFIHGGSWASHMVFGDQKHWQGDYVGYLARYYAEKGFVCVSLDYRLSRNVGQENNYGIIECYDDCCDALDYVISHAEEYGIDTENVYLLGESAGGHLAGALATFQYDRKYFFEKIFLINPITHLHDKWKTRVPVNSNHPRLMGLSLNERADFLSPLCQIDKGVGEVVLIHGEDDTTVDLEHSLMFHDRMTEVGNKSELHIIEKTDHAFLLVEYYKKGVEACKIAIDIINDHITFGN